MGILGPTLVFGEHKLPADVQLTQIVSPSGDIEFFWNARALRDINFVDLKIDYSYDDKDKVHRTKPISVDASLGEAAFRNLSFEETYKFHFTLNTGDGQSFRESGIVDTPSPNRAQIANPSVRDQLAYADAHWQTRANPSFMYIDSNDCANFVSQTLAARGLVQDKTWNQVDQVPTRAWVSASALNDYVLGLPGTVQLTDGQRDQVKLGDLVFFDWDRSGDRDHVGVVNYIQKQADGSIRIYYAGHTSHKHFRSVDWATHVLHPNAAVYFVSLPRTPSKYAWDTIFSRD